MAANAPGWLTLKEIALLPDVEVTLRYKLEIMAQTADVQQNPHR